MERLSYIVALLVVVGLFILGFIVGHYLHSLALDPLSALHEAWDRFMRALRAPFGPNFLGGPGDGGTSEEPVTTTAPFGRAPDGYIYQDEFDCHNGRDASGFTCLAVDAPEIA